MAPSKLLARTALGAVALLALTAGLPAAAAGGDPVQRLARWVEDYRKGAGELPSDRENELAALIADLRMTRLANPERTREVAQGLLDLAGVQPRRAARGGNPFQRADSATARVREYGRRALERLLEEDGGTAAWMASSVIALPRTQPEERRVAALELLAGRHDPATLVAVLESAISKEPRVRAAALEALVGWQDDSVHRFFLSQVQASSQGDPDGPWPHARRHFGSLVLLEEAPATAAVREFVAQGLLATDWRDTVRALRLGSALPDSKAVPHLIEALAVWLGRAERGEGSKRIEGELLAELKRRSKRNIGPHPERWSTWWRSRTRPGAEPELDGPEPVRTRSGFFGLRPMTDRVAFVIDRSGSMAGGFAGSGRSRYEEAIAQMEGFLRELGPDTRFRVILFDSGLQVWSTGLKPATDTNLAHARNWAASRGVGGSTALRGGVEEVFRLGRDGRPDLGRIEEDTVIVLCDGDTNEGPDWVPGLMKGPNSQACIAIHGVQIGAGGDGTLELLAEGSGGEFVVVGQ